MPYLTLTLSGYPVDLPADAQVALSYRVNDVRNLDSREAAFSETFTLPLTANNRQVLGNPHDLASGSTTPYRLLPAVLTSPGGTVLLNGYGIVEAASGAGYDVMLTDAAGALFATVGNRSLRELDLTALDHPLTYAGLHAADANTYAVGGYTYALFDTGVLAGRPVNFDLTPDELPASVFVHTLLLAMLADPLPPAPLPAGYVTPPNPLAGYRLTGSLLADPLYQQLVLPRATATPQLRAGYLEANSVEARTLAATTLTAAGPLAFPYVLSGGATLAQNTYYYPPAHPAGLKVSLQARVTQTGGGAYLALYQQEGSQPPVVVQSWVLAAGTSTLKLEYTLPVAAFTATTRLYVGLGIVPGPVQPSVQLAAGASVHFELQAQAWAGAPVHLDAGLPALSQADLLKQVFTMFNAVLQVDPITRTLRLDVLNDIERNRNRAVDWTSRLDLTALPRLAYRLPDYAQANTLAYAQLPEQVTDELLPTPALAQGQGTLLVRDATLPATREAFASELVLPLEHGTGFGSFALLWVPFLTLTDDGRLAELWDSTRSYSFNNRVIYKGQAFQYIGVSNSSGTPPPWGDPNQASNTQWHRLEDAWQVANEAVSSIARLAPNDAVRVLDYGQHGDSYVPSHRLSRQGLPFSDLLLAYYPTFARCCERLLLLTVDVRLDGLDVANLDFTRPVRLGPVDIPHYGRLSMLGYLNLIDQWQPGFPGAVAVQLLVLGAPVPGLAPAVPMPVTQHLHAFVDEADAYYLLSEDGQYLLLE